MRKATWNRVTERLFLARDKSSGETRQHIEVALRCLHSPEVKEELTTPTTVHQTQRTVASVLKQPSPISLPRNTYHAIERTRSQEFQEARLAQQGAEDYVQAHRNNLEQVLSGSQAEMKKLFSQLTKLRELQKKIEMAYLTHYYRSIRASELMTPVTKVKAGASGKVPEYKEEIASRIKDLPEDEQAQAAEVLKRLGFI